MASSANPSSPSPFSPDPSIKAEKAALRKCISARLRALDDTHVTAEAKRLFPRLLELEAVKRSECLSLYLSMPSKEVPTFPILLTVLMEGGKQEGDASSTGGEARRKKKVYVPKVIGPASADMVMLPLSSPQDIASFPLSKWGIPEPVLPPSPLPSLPPLDLVIVPGVAFDANCNRLGHGKGYYDCFLSRLQASHAREGRQRPYTVGLALDEQIVESVPLDAFDLPIDAVVTPSKVFLR
ncbi:5-formyltetrahydrofolate cyclo-ligase [Nannochloropsis oceanica]